MSALGINIGALIAQLAVFLIVLWVLGKYAFPVLTKTLDTREAKIREGIENAERSRRELAEAEKRVEALLNQARLDSQATIAKATQAAEHVKAEIEQDAQRRAREIQSQAEKRIEQMLVQARAQLRQEVADLAIMAAEHVVGTSLDQTTSRRLVSEFVAQSAQTAQTRDVQC